MSTTDPIRDDPPPADGPPPADWSRDRALVEAAVAGDEAARNEVARRMDCIPLFVSDTNRRRGSPLSTFELEEVARNVVLTVWQRLPSFQGLARLETWIFRFCEFTISNAIRRNAPVTVSLDTTQEPEGSTCGDGALTSVDASRVREALGRLEGLEAAVLIQRYFEGCRFDEIATRLAVSVHVVHRAHVRGLKRLEAKLGPMFRSDGP